MSQPTQAITIADYDPAWPAAFEAEQARLLDLVGDKLVAVEHIGSTSVPGLAAKPIVDILAGVATMADAEACIAPLTAAGWRYGHRHESEVPARRYFSKGDHAGTPGSAHLHVVETHNRVWWERHLVFRDYLRAHPDAAADYARLKRDLATRYPDDRAAYTDAKTPFIRATEAHAYAERGIEPPPPEPQYAAVTPDRWPDLEALFGPRGATAGCWCMWWRIPRSQWEAQRYDGNRAAFHAIVQEGAIPGVLVYVNGEPAGWCAVQPREAYPVLDRSRVLKRVDDAPVWSLTCLFVARKHRRQGLTDWLVRAAIARVRAGGGRVLEAYPVEPKSDQAHDFSTFTGLASTFRKAGFVEVARRSETRPILRFELGG